MPSAVSTGCATSRTSSSLQAAGRGATARRSKARETRRSTARSDDEHGVAIGVETIPLGDRFAIGGEHVLASGEGTDQEQEARARQVEVRDQRVDCAEFERR